MLSTALTPVLTLGSFSYIILCGITSLLSDINPKLLSKENGQSNLNNTTPHNANENILGDFFNNNLTTITSIIIKLDVILILNTDKNILSIIILHLLIIIYNFLNLHNIFV